MKYFRLLLYIIPTLIYVIPSLSLADETKNWPREIKVKSGLITVYQPQLESFKNTKVTARAAVAYKKSSKGAPVFGVSWFTARAEIDRDQRIVQYDNFKITEIRFPENIKNIEDEFKKAVLDGFDSWNLNSSLDDLTTALASIEQEQKINHAIKNIPPKIIYKNRPAILVYIDGEEVLQKVENSQYSTVVNTPYPLFTDNKKTWFLNAANEVWYKANNIDGPYVYTTKVPQKLSQLVSQKNNDDQYSDSTDSDYEIDKSTAPLVVITHSPTELVVSRGEAEFESLTDDLLVMKNSDTHVFLDLPSQKYYLIISGRWYKAKSMNSNWTYVSADSLPQSIVNIPKKSNYKDARSYIAGTDEAKEAIMDAQIPQTATVKRGYADITVSYDGNPKFEKISGTNLSFAINSNETVIKSINSYYVVTNAVWYISNNANGPWQVSDHAPADIENIPPSNPVYNTKYVYVYDSTPDVVYVGYTPGYVGSYIYGPTIVYGTGWYYPPYISPIVYYPRPATWGFAVTYNPYTGWGFGVSWSSGPFRLGFYSGGGYHGRSHHGYWGAGGYRPSFNNINIDINNNININNSFNDFKKNKNIYKRDNQKAQIKNTINSRDFSKADKARAQNKLSDSKKKQDARNKLNNKNIKENANVEDIRQKAAKVDKQNLQKRANNYKIATGNNNILADKKGNIYRKQDGQWQQRVNDNWKQFKPSVQNKELVKQKTAKARSGYQTKSSMDRDQFSRQRSNERVRHHQQQSRNIQRARENRPSIKRRN